MNRASADQERYAPLAGAVSRAPRVRRATIDDAPRVAAAGARLFAQTFDGLMDPDDIAVYLRATYGPVLQADELRDPGTAVWIAENEPADAVGFAMLRQRALPVPVDPRAVPAARDAVELARIYVDRAWQGHRVGATLLAACVSEARAWGGSMLWLSVWKQNARAIRFYQRLGLRVVGEQDFVVGSDRQRDHVMVLPLR